MKYILAISILCLSCKKEIEQKQTVKFSFNVGRSGIYFTTKTNADVMLIRNAYLKVRWSIYSMEVRTFFNESPTPNISFVYKFLRYEYADVVYDKYFNGPQIKTTNIRYPFDILTVIIKSPTILEIKSDDPGLQFVW